MRSRGAGGAGGGGGAGCGGGGAAAKTGAASDAFSSCTSTQADKGATASAAQTTVRTDMRRPPGNRCFANSISAQEVPAKGNIRAVSNCTVIMAVGEALCQNPCGDFSEDCSCAFT